MLCFIYIIVVFLFILETKGSSTKGLWK